MRPIRLLTWCFASCLVLCGQPVQAAWNNVFQVCCKRCGSHPSTSAYYTQPYASGYYSNYAPPADPCCTPPPQRVCTTRYITRTYYQPVTTYQTQSYYEKVTSYRSSFYWEPVVSYRYTTYYDPSSCSYKQSACPRTCYRLRTQSCPVENLVLRCRNVPVTTYKPYCTYEPVTSCCTTGGGETIPPQENLNSPPPGVNNPPPGVKEERTPGAGIRDSSDQGPYESNRLRPRETIPPASGLINRQYPFESSPPPRVGSTPAPAPKVTIDRIAAIPATNVEGQVVANDEASTTTVRILFCSEDRQGVKQYVTPDAKGHFEVNLAAGKWQVYTHETDAESKPVLQTKLVVTEDHPQTLRLVAR